MSDEDTTHPDYDFSDFNLGCSIEQDIRNLLREAFRAFKAEGRWGFENNSMVWETAPGAEFWGDEMPLAIRMMASDFSQAVAREIDLRDGEDKEEFIEALRQWREAIGRAEAMVRAMSDSTRGA